jgi:hypothetical protein
MAKNAMVLEITVTTRCKSRGLCPAVLGRIAPVRVKVRLHGRKLIEGTPEGFSWLVIVGEALTVWLVTGLGATLVAACLDKKAAPPRPVTRYHRTDRLVSAASAERVEAHKPSVLYHGGHVF